MITLHRLLSLPVCIASIFIAHSLASPADGFIDTSQDGSIDYSISLTGGESCTSKQLKQIQSGFHEMSVLFASAQSPDFSQQAERDFFGKPDQIFNYTTLITENLARAAQYANAKGDRTHMPDFHVRCDDPNNICNQGNEKDGMHTIYNIASEPHFNFCDAYFKLDALDDRIGKDSGDDQQRLNLMYYYNRASWARMVMHVRAVGHAIKPIIQPDTNPDSISPWLITYTSENPMNLSVLAGVSDFISASSPVQDITIRHLNFAYGVTRAKLLAILPAQDPYDAANNAENYALYALARYVMLRKGFYPRLPSIDEFFGSNGSVDLMDNESRVKDRGEGRFAYLGGADVVPLRDGVSAIGNPLSSAAGSGVFMRWRGKALWVWLVVCSSSFL
ncbi:unnamed protein product [Periconia digitata]|uniref:Uncharacterized protein n=1 Tax=Periconia digitata TaxID=1303443 RepID=A0A9W4XPY9_9PLEO|nr:unnamed protein product [Periconia digitata]